MAINLQFKQYIINKCNLNFDLIKSGENPIGLSFSFSTIIPKDFDKECSIKILTTFSNNNNVFFSFELKTVYTLETDNKISTDEINQILKEKGFSDSYDRVVDFVNKFCEISNISPLPMPGFDEVKPQ